ncbi:hypothetical protein [Paraburkholderia dilworthii]|uniref:hypothetical protein n=1 Tax=Paraburkholderia dilworthii TaxID=948106 RepID=UPI0004211036|nr:hypothetical protein [Paraburkholderia dilworthii]
MSFVSKPFSVLHRKRAAIALVALPLCALLGACGNDDPKAPDTGNASSALNSAPNSTDNGNTTALSANPSSASPSPAAVTIQSPALPASNADPALSAAASTPLAAPVIHTVD